LPHALPAVRLSTLQFKVSFVVPEEEDATASSHETIVNPTAANEYLNTLPPNSEEDACMLTDAFELN
jgi:hypothetical protein